VGLWDSEIRIKNTGYRIQGTEYSSGRVPLLKVVAESAY